MMPAAGPASELSGAGQRPFPGKLRFYMEISPERPGPSQSPTHTFSRCLGHILSLSFTKTYKLVEKKINRTKA